jgi:hypothetical protein
MEHRRFDQLTKLMAAGGTRRTALRLLGGSALATGLARLGLSPAAGAPIGTADDKDANCRGSCAQCERGGQCCSGRCEGGVCQCKPRGSCAHDRACCSGRCGSDGRCKRAPDPGCGVGGPNPCANPTSFCDADESPCGGENSDCKCVPTLSGGSLCVFSIRCLPDQTTCQTDVDCRFAGEVCIPPAATQGCSFQCGGNGNACATPCGPDATRAAAAEREGWVMFRPGDR